MNLKCMMLNQRTHILKTYILYDSVYMIIWKEYRDRKQISGFQGPGVRGESEYKRQHAFEIHPSGTLLNSSTFNSTSRSM